MTKRQDKRQRLKELQRARAMTLDELTTIGGQIAELQGRKDTLETALADPEQATTAGAATELGSLLDRIASLERVKPSLESRKNAQDEAIRQVLAEVNHDAVIEARPGEYERFEAVIDAARALWDAIAEYDQYLHECIYPHKGRPLTGIPRDLIAWLNPGAHGGFNRWARTDHIKPGA